MSSLELGDGFYSGGSTLARGFGTAASPRPIFMRVANGRSRT
jgi:hypothetical protein